MTLDTSGVVPVYYQLKELLRQEIGSHVYPPGSQIPSEHELVRTYGVSRATVRHAIDGLVQEGLLSKRQGKGTFVAAPKLEDDLLGMTTFKQQVDKKGLKDSIKILTHYARPARQRDRELFGVPAEERILRILRLILVEEEPVFIESWEIPERHCPGLFDLDLNRPFFKVLVDNYGLNLHRVVKYIEPTLADDFEAKTLGIKAGQPVMLIERISYPPGDGPALVVCKWIVRGDRCRHLVRVGE